MNNYDYMNFLNGIPNNIPNQLLQNNIIPNYMTENMNFNSLNNNLTEPYEGFIRGNIFNNLYEPYKNYKPNKLNPKNEKEALLYQWLQYNFALTELKLYLDVNPNDNNAINLYNEYLNIFKQLQNKFETSYGPIDSTSEVVALNKWNWISNPWPWEGGK